MTVIFSSIHRRFSGSCTLETITAHAIISLWNRTAQLKRQHLTVSLLINLKRMNTSFFSFCYFYRVEHSQTNQALEETHLSMYQICKKKTIDGRIDNLYILKLNQDDKHREKV